MTERKKIVIITSQAFSLLNFRYMVLEHLIENDIEVYAMAPDFQSSDRKKLLSMGINPVEISLSRTLVNPFRLIYELFDLIIKVKKIQPTYTLTYFAKPVILGNLAAIISGVKKKYSIIEGLGNFRESLNSNMLSVVGVSILYKISLYKINKVFFTNNEDKDFFLKHSILLPKYIVMIGGIGVNLDYWCCDEVSALTNKDKDSIVFIMSARLIKLKGVLEYLDAAEIVKSRYPNTEFILLGGFDENSTTLNESDIQYYIDNEIVHWKGNVDNVKSWLCSSDIFVLPSYYGEGVPRSIQEAMACSMPIITTNWTGCKDTVEDNINGLLVPIKNVDRLSKAMIFYVENYHTVSTHGENSLRIAHEKFDEIVKSGIIVDNILKS
jgi:glycosyltransferase involved in cell wall biosynthesis